MFSRNKLLISGVVTIKVMTKEITDTEDIQMLAMEYLIGFRYNKLQYIFVTALQSKQHVLLNVLYVYFNPPFLGGMFNWKEFQNFATHSYEIDTLGDPHFRPECISFIVANVLFLVQKYKKVWFNLPFISWVKSSFLSAYLHLYINCKL